MGTFEGLVDQAGGTLHVVRGGYPTVILKVGALVLEILDRHRDRLPCHPAANHHRFLALYVVGFGQIRQLLAEPAIEVLPLRLENLRHRGRLDRFQVVEAAEVVGQGVHLAVGPDHPGGDLDSPHPEVGPRRYVGRWTRLPVPHPFALLDQQVDGVLHRGIADAGFSELADQVLGVSHSAETVL